MKNKIKDLFTKVISLGWWGGLIILLVDALIIDCSIYAGIPWVGIIIFGVFVILSLTKLYDRKSIYSPYRSIYEAIRSFKRKKV